MREADALHFVPVNWVEFPSSAKMVDFGQSNNCTEMWSINGYFAALIISLNLKFAVSSSVSNFELSSGISFLSLMQVLLLLSLKSAAQVRQLLAAPPLHVRHEPSHLAQLELPDS